MPLYVINEGGIRQIRPGRFNRERQLQRLFEANLEVLLGVRCIGSEFPTGDRQRGRIDTLGLDYDGTPTIIEYKRSQRDNIINQGLFYLDWLVDHKGDFVLAAQAVLGPDVEVQWDSPRLILIAESFNDYDKYAVNRIGANIELWVYRLYGEDLLYLEPIFAPHTRTITPTPEIVEAVENVIESAAMIDGIEPPQYTVEGHLEKAKPTVRDAFEILREFIFELAGDEGEIIETANKLYIGYRHGKNFTEVVVQVKALRIFLDIPFEELNDPAGIARDVTDVGHWGTGNVEVRVEKPQDVVSVLPLIEQAYRLTL